MFVANTSSKPAFTNVTSLPERLMSLSRGQSQVVAACAVTLFVINMRENFPLIQRSWISIFSREPQATIPRDRVKQYQLPIRPSEPFAFELRAQDRVWHIEVQGLDRQVLPALRQRLGGLSEEGKEFTVEKFEKDLKNPKSLESFFWKYCSSSTFLEFYRNSSEKIGRAHV